MGHLLSKLMRTLRLQQSLYFYMLEKTSLLFSISISLKSDSYY